MSDLLWCSSVTASLDTANFNKANFNFGVSMDRFYKGKKCFKLLIYLYTQVKIQRYREEVSSQRSQIEMLKGLEKENKQLATRIAELKVIKKGKFVAVQTNLVSLHKYVAIYCVYTCTYIHSSCSCLM